MNPLIKIVKKALSDKYGYKNVRVINGRGTAWGWVEASITMPKPKEMTDEQTKSIYRNPIDKEITKNAELIAYEAVKKSGLKFYTYADDGGYGDHDCFMLSVHYI